jgi:UDP-glucose 4-epimerase
MFRNIDFVGQLLRGEKVGIEWGRDKKKNVWHMNRKDIIVSTRTRMNEGNAQVLVAKIPIFHQAIQNFGTSRLTRPLRDEPESISPVEKGEIDLLMEKMLSESVDITDEVYQKNFQDQVMKVNWDVNGNFAYQIFEENQYNYEFGKHIEDADLTLVIENPDYAKRFLLDLPTNYGPALDSNDNFLIFIKIPVLSIQFKNPDEDRLVLVKLPFFRELIRNVALEEKKDERENYGYYISANLPMGGYEHVVGPYIPVNLPMGDFESEVVPYKVFEYFINKASNIVLRKCPCRERGDCQNHSIELGCIFMGDDTKNMALSPGEGYVATKEQALEHVRSAIAEGLVPLLGRNVAEAENGHGVKDTGRFLSGCFCCECCCIGVIFNKYSLVSDMEGASRRSIKGMKIKVDYEKCDGCKTCIETCPFKLRKEVDGKSSVDPNRCRGCGRCVSICPNKAISIEIEDPKYIENYIAKIESIVDVEAQKT